MQHILVVDDDPLVLDALSERLGFMGFAVHQATDGVQALTALAAQPLIEVVLSDTLMPRMNGIDLAKTIASERGENVAVEVILMSGSVSNVNLVGTLIFGAMRKPISGKELYALITLALESAHSRRSRAMARSSGSDL